MNQLFDKKESWGKRKRKNQQDKALAEMVKLAENKAQRFWQIVQINPG